MCASLKDDYKMKCNITVLIYNHSKLFSLKSLTVNYLCLFIYLSLRKWPKEANWPTTENLQIGDCSKVTMLVVGFIYKFKPSLTLKFLIIRSCFEYPWLRFLVTIQQPWSCSDHPSNTIHQTLLIIGSNSLSESKIKSNKS